MNNEYKLNPNDGCPVGEIPRAAVFPKRVLTDSL